MALVPAAARSHGLLSHSIHGTWHPHGSVWANGPKVGPCFLSGAASDGCPARMQHGFKTNKVG